MDIGLITILLFGSLFLLLALGMPVAFSLGSVAVVFSLLLWGVKALYIMPTQVLGQMIDPILIAVPLFVLMAHVLQRSGIADDLYETMYSWLGGLRGGLAMGTVLIGTVFAAMTGGTTPGTLSMGLIALPAMLKRNYNKVIAVGCISAGGVLGIVIPPSVIMIIFATLTKLSVGRLFFGGVIPGFLIAGMHATYIGIRCYFRPNLGPAIPREERASLGKKLISLKSVALPIGLILVVLGSIYTGAATPTEAASIGALGAFVCAVVHGRFNRQMLSGATLGTLKLTGMIMWILAAAACFNALYIGLGGQRLIIEVISGLGVNPWVILIGMQLSLFFFGMIMDDYAIVMLCGPIYTPIIITLGFDPHWFGILFVLNMQMAYLTPPFGYNLFLMKSIVPEGVTMGDIYRSIIPFVAIQALGLVLVMVFPQLALWLPSTMIK